MKISTLRGSSLFTILALLATGALACGGGEDSSHDPQNLMGTWRNTTIHVLGQTTTCPGEIELTEGISVSCTTDTLTFHEDGSVVQVQTTNKYGDPYDWRAEGTWSVDDDLLIVTITEEGPDADSLQPIEPPESYLWMWNVSQDTLTIGWTISVATVEATFERQN